MKNEYTIPIYVKGNSSSIFYNNSDEEIISKDKLKETIDLYLSDLKDDTVNKEIAFFGDSFTSLDESVQDELLETAYQYVVDEKVNYIRISTSPKYINKLLLKKLKKYKVNAIELNVQTSNDYILNRCKLDFNFNDVKNASKLIRRYGFELGFQIMVGLPESTKLDELNTARDLAKLKPKFIRIYPLVVIQNTIFADSFKDYDYSPLTIGQAIERCKDLYYYFNKKRINYIHIGFQNSNLTMNLDNIEKHIIAGPYHHAFDQLVEDSIWYDSIVDRIKKFNVKVKEVEILTNSANAKNVTGYENENFKKLKDIYDVDVNLIIDNEKASR